MNSDAELLGGDERGAPESSLEPPVVNAARVEGYDLSSDLDAAAHEAQPFGAGLFHRLYLARTRDRASAPSVRMSASSASRSIAARALWMVGSTKLQERGVVVRAVDEDEAPGVLELALHGNEVELSADLGANRPRRAPYARRILPSARR